MHRAVEEFVERMAVTLEGHGLPRIAGRLFAFLLVNGEAVSLDELAEELQVSKASVSTNARLLEASSAMLSSVVCPMTGIMMLSWNCPPVAPLNVTV